MKLTDIPARITREAIEASGITNVDDINDAVADFMSDGYWNDPKCAGRRIAACNGNRSLFFDYLEGVDWGE